MAWCGIAEGWMRGSWGMMACWEEGGGRKKESQLQLGVWWGWGRGAVLNSTNETGETGVSSAGELLHLLSSRVGEYERTTRE